MNDQLNWRVEGEHVCFLDPNGKVRSKRPATEQEIEIWRLYKEQLDLEQGQANIVRSLQQTEAGLMADVKSLSSACEAYREQQLRLAGFLVDKFPGMMGEGSVVNDATAVAIELLGNYKIVKDAGLSGAAAYAQSLANGPVVDAYAVPGSVGANPTAKPGKRKASDVKKRGE